MNELINKKIKYKELVIIGGGPAGLTALIYSTRAKLDTLLLENDILGGQVVNSYRIENYPGFKNITGIELVNNIRNQAEELGAKIDEFDEINTINFTDEKKIIETANCIYWSDAVIIATGASPQKLDIPSESIFMGKGVHYCAVCDAFLYSEKIVAVIGGGNSALEEAMYLSKFAKKVIIIRRKNYFNGEKIKIEEVESNPKIEVMFNEELVDIKGKTFIEFAIVRNVKTGKERRISINAVFGCIGTEPKTAIFKNVLKLTSYGHIITDEDMRTNIKGVYAAGDVREKNFRQITTAVSDGTIAALCAEKYIIEKRING